MGASAPAALPRLADLAGEEAGVPLSLRPLCNSYRLGLARRLAGLDRSGQYGPRPVSPELFDFQEGAARWLAARFEVPGGYSLLEMAAGCGKTRALGAFLSSALPPSALCLYVTQPGLVRQTCAELQRVFPRLACCKAESSKELALARRAGVIVVNAALPGALLPLSARAWCVVVDEAHRASGCFLARLARSCGASSKLVLSSATPSAGGSLSTLAANATDEQHFVMLKTASVAEALCMPRVVLEDRSYRAESVRTERVAEALDSIGRQGPSPLPYFLLCAAL
jgi:hypothetical protein